MLNNFFLNKMLLGLSLVLFSSSASASASAEVTEEKKDILKLLNGLQFNRPFKYSILNWALVWENFRFSSRLCGKKRKKSYHASTLLVECRYMKFYWKSYDDVAFALHLNGIRWFCTNLQIQCWDEVHDCGICVKKVTSSSVLILLLACSRDQSCYIFLRHSASKNCFQAN